MRKMNSHQVTGKTPPQLCSPRVMWALLIGFGWMLAVVLGGAFVLSYGKKMNLRYSKWCEDRGYVYVARGRYCRDGSTGQSIKPPDLHLDSVSKREGVL